MSLNCVSRKIHRRGLAGRGFTLVELLIVIFIIGILVALTLTVVVKVKTAVYGAQTNAQLATIASAINQYYADFRAYPGPLANNQLYYAYDSLNQPGVNVVVGGTSTFFALAGKDDSGTTPPYPSAYQPATDKSFSSNITGSQNLVLGLLGGLELTYNTSGVVTGFVYNPTDILANDGVSPAPHGPASLNPNTPRRQQSYLQVRPGDISVPNKAYGSNGASFADAAGRFPTDSAVTSGDAMIPVFLDKYSQPLPILYYRTNVGGTAIVGLRDNSGTGLYVNDVPARLQDANGNNLIPQFDLTQNLPYVSNSASGTLGAIGTISKNPNSYHGLQGVTGAGNESSMLLISSATAQTPPVDSIDYKAPGQSFTSPTNNGNNGLSYFKDPSLNSTAYDGVTGNTNKGVARQKDGYVLISAGPDRLYGTSDDLIYPGPLQP